MTTRPIAPHHPISRIENAAAAHAEATSSRGNDFAIGRSAIRGNSDQFSFDRSFLDLLYVHPGEGAWVWHAVDGAQGDEDGPNGVTTIDISKGAHLLGAAPPKVFSPGGTLVAVDFEDLAVLTTDVQALLPGSCQLLQESFLEKVRMKRPRLRRQVV